MSSQPRRIELTGRAQRDLRQLDPTTRRRVLDALDQLAHEAENLDVKALAGRMPWRRLRVGTLRVLFRPSTDAERRALGAPGYYVHRAVNRRDLDRAVDQLPWL